MEQLGAGFKSGFLLPYIQNKILGDIENDKIIQNIFRYDKMVTPGEFNELVDNSFKNTGTILQQDEGLRIAFWKEFIEFVKRQKKLCNGNVIKLTFRLLPDAKTGAFSDVAQQNIQKFVFYAAGRLEDTLAQREIDKKKVLGEISAAKAADDKADLDKGKLILLRKEDGKFDYMSDKEIASAIGNVEKTAGMLANLDTEQTPEGEIRVFAMNPSDDGSSSVQGIQQLLWEKQSMTAEKQLEDNGLYVEAHMSIDANGISAGTAQDANGTRLIIEFDVKKPGERNYRITLADDPNKKFFLSENELKQKFGKEKKSAYDVLREKEAQAGYGIAKPRGSRLADGAGAPIKLPSERKIRIPVTRSVSGTGEEAGVGVRPYVPNVGGNPAGNIQQENAISSSTSATISGAIEAKRALAERMGGAGAEMQTEISLPGSSKEASPGKLKASRQRPEKSFMWFAAKVTGAGIGGTIGLSGIFSLLT